MLLCAPAAAGVACGGRCHTCGSGYGMSLSLCSPEMDCAHSLSARPRRGLDPALPPPDRRHPARPPAGLNGDVPAPAPGQPTVAAVLPAVAAAASDAMAAAAGSVVGVAATAGEALGARQLY